MITLDTSGILALVNRGDPSHTRTAAALRGVRPPHLVPCEILAEVAYLLERWHGRGALDTFLGHLASGGLSADHAPERMFRIRELAHRYADLPLGFADASVVACAEDHGGRVLTLDRRDFDVVAREGRLELLPSA